VVLVVEVVERLRELEGVLGDKGGLLRRDGCVSSVVEHASLQK
jgi:hypothetical protein